MEEPLYEEDLSEIEPDAQVLRKIQEIQEGQEPVLAQKVSDTDTSLWGGWVNDLVEVRMYETNLGDLSADPMPGRQRPIWQSREKRRNISLG